MAKVLQGVKQTYISEFTAQTLLNSLSYCVWLSDKDSRIIFTNLAFGEYLGINSDTRPILSSIVHSDDLEEIRRMLYDEKRTYNLNRIIARVRRFDGVYRWCYICSYPLYGPENLLYGYLGTLTDISNAMSNFNLDEMMSEFFDSKYENVPFGLLVIDQDDQIIFCNDMCETITSRSKEQLLYKNWKLFDYSNNSTELACNLEKIKSGEKERINSLLKLMKPDQSEVWITVTVFSLKENGTDSGKYMFVINDITENIHLAEQTSAQERFLSLFWSDRPGMIFRCQPGPEASMSYVSEGCFQLTGYDQRFLTTNKRFYFNKVINKEYRQYLYQRRNEAIQENRIHKDEYMITTSAGEQRWVFEQLQGIYDASGQLVVVEGLVSDITKSKEKDYEILKMQYHDPVTGINNRRFFEASCRNLDRIDRLPVTVVVVKVSGLRLVKEALGQSVRDELMVSVSQIITRCCKDKDVVAVTGEDEFTVLLPESDYDQACNLIQQIRMQMKVSKDKIYSKTGLITGFFGCATKKNKHELLCDVVHQAEKNLYFPCEGEQKHHAAFPNIYSSQRFMRRQISERSARVHKLCHYLGLRFNLDEDEMNRLKMLSMVHNIGLAEVSSNILLKQGKLTRDEWAVIKMHPEIGYRIALASAELACVAEEILYHHEWWNGAGYPKGLKGEEIPFLSRILAVADAYDAMTNERPYRFALSKEKAIEEIKMYAGIRFDHSVVRMFLHVIQEEGLD